MLNKDKQSKAEIRHWILQHADAFTHVLTLTLKPGYATAAGAHTVARRFHEKLNKAVWGGRRCRTRRIAWCAVVQGGDTERCHIHAAIGNFPKHLIGTMELLKRVRNTIKHTDGVWKRNDFDTIESTSHKGLDYPAAVWCRYISRQLKDGADMALLVDDLEWGSKYKQ